MSPPLSPLSPFIDRITCGDAIRTLKLIPDESVDCVVTSPPYWQLRDYGVRGQIGLESTIEEYLANLSEVFDEVRRVLKDAGTCWVNLGDTYSGKRAGLIHKNLLQIPSRFALRMTESGWRLRNEIIWHKPNCMPESVRDRFTMDYEKLYFFTKSVSYYFRQQFEPLRDRASLLRQRRFNRVGAWKRINGDKFISTVNPKTAEASRLKALQRGRNKRCVWTIPTRAFRDEHFATYPPELVETPIKAGCPPGGIVLDPFAGAGTTALVAQNLGRRFIGIELNPAYVRLAEKRLAQPEHVRQAAA